MVEFCDQIVLISFATKKQKSNNLIKHQKAMKPIANELSNEQKSFVEYAASLGGFDSVDEFMIHSALEKAMEIVRTYGAFLETSGDKEIFFEALLNPPKPNRKLYDAAKEYLNYVNEK